MIQPIVEGHGETSAFPILLRRLAAEANVHDLRVGPPIRQRRADLVDETRLKRAVEIAWRQPETTFVIVLFDADHECPKTLAPKILQWAGSVRSQPCAVVIANREYESWFLAAIESLQGHASIQAEAAFPGDPEQPRGAKEILEGLMVPSVGAYVETVDQARFSATMDLRSAYLRSRSFRHLVKALGGVLRNSPNFTGAWPPPSWQ